MKTTIRFTLLTWALLPAALLAQPTRPVDLEKDKNLYVVGYAHLDTQWRWSYPQVIREFIPNTMRQNFPLFEKYPDYVFNFSGSRRYKFMKEYYPEDYAKVQELAKKGRWFPAGSSVDENDAIVPSLESYVRHALYGNRFFDREFGVHSEEFMLPDCFGFPYALPSLLAHNGIKGFITQKLTWKSANGIPFKFGNWEGPDGKSVLAALDGGDYTGKLKDDISLSEMWLKRITEGGKDSGIFADLHFHGTGDRGGTPGEKSVEWLEQAVKNTTAPVRVIAAKSDQIFKDITAAQAAKLPRYKGELLLIEHSAGSITSQAYMKRWNRKNELLANAAETAAAQAFILGSLPYPHNTLYRAWDLVLGSQMHDILPGTSLPRAYEYSWNDEVLALNQFASVLESSVAAVAANLDTTAQGVPLVVYNPLSIEREDPVEATVPFTATEAPTVFGPDGKAVPTQLVSRGDGTVTLLFLARVPGLGYATFDVRPGAPTPAPNNLLVTDKSLENDRYKVFLDANGDLASVFDKKAARELLSSPARLSFHYENPEQYPAWNMDWVDRQKPPLGFVEGPAKIRVVENGPVRVALEVSREARGSTIVQKIRLSAGSAGDRVEVANLIDWRTQGVSFKANFPLTASNPSATYDAQIGTVSRTNNREKQFEVPQHQWLDLTDAQGEYGVAILNDSKYGSDKPTDNTVRLTLLYTPMVRKSYQDQSTQDIGRHEFIYALAGHAGDWSSSDIPWSAARINQPLFAFRAPSHAGLLGKRFAPVSLNSNQVSIAAVKIAEDSDEVIVRVKELTGKAADGLQLTMADQITAAREVNGQEREVGPATFAGEKLTFALTPYAVKAFAIKLAKPATAAPAITSLPVTLTYDLDAISTDKNRADGDFDGKGNTYPAEQLPANLEREGLTFRLGSSADGVKNAVAAKGQKIELPPGNFNRVYLLASSIEGDVSTAVTIGENSSLLTVQQWTGLIGQWDNRIWGGEVPELTYEFTNPMIGLVPGYIKRAPVAWFATHYHQPKGNTYYQFSHLFKYGFDLPKGTTSLTLPGDGKIRVFAVTVATEPGAGLSPAAALYDTLELHRFDSAALPNIQGADRAYTNSTGITVDPPLYHQPKSLRYTLDGSDPQENSAIYEGPIEVNRPATLKVSQLGPDGRLGAVASAAIKVNDATPPTLLHAKSAGDRLLLTFSESMDAVSAKEVSNYKLDNAPAIRGVEMSEDQRVVTLLLDGLIAEDKSVNLRVTKVGDASPNRNFLADAQVTIPANQVYHLAEAKVPTQAVAIEVDQLPLQSADSWTLHVFVRVSQTPAPRTLLVGFGSSVVKKAKDGEGRYLVVAENGISFWGKNRDVTTNSPLDLNRWQLLTAVYDGETMILYKDGQMIGKKELKLWDDATKLMQIAPLDAWDQASRLDGELRAVTLLRRAVSAEEVKSYLKANLPK